MRWALTGLLILLAFGGPRPVRAIEPGAVIVLHGLARTRRSMQTLADRIEAAGYAVHNVEYPSTSEPMPQLAAEVRRTAESCCAEAERLDFVTYSMGGLVVRSLLAEWRPPNLGRVVMIAPPSQGTEIVDTLRRSRVARWFYGPVFSHLGTDADSLPNRLGPADFDVGVIAGDRVLSPLGHLLIAGESDGTVPVERTRLAGMADHIVLPYSHTFIMNAPRVADETLCFLAHGRFSDGAPRATRD